MAEKSSAKGAIPLLYSTGKDIAGSKKKILAQRE